MERRRFIQNGVVALAAAALPGLGSAVSFVTPQLRVRLLRHATILVEIAGMRILVDPMLSNKGTMNPVANAMNDTRIPMVDLPISTKELDTILAQIDAVLITHLHRDHWDFEAQRSIPRSITVLCQPGDEGIIKSQGFSNVHPVSQHMDWHGVRIYRAGGQHGTGETGVKMGNVSGFVLDAVGHKLYIAGDTIWCGEVEDALRIHKPDHVIVNAGAARFKSGGPITMTGSDMLTLQSHTNAIINIVHLETVNHCGESRQDYRNLIAEHRLASQVFVPADGDWLVS